MTRQQRGLAAAAGSFLVLVAVDFLGFEGAILAAGITGLLYIAAWSIAQVFADAIIKVDGARASLDDTQEFRDWRREMDELPEPEWADPTPLEQKRLRSVPIPGGIVRRPQLTIVGNGDPELVVPLPEADDAWLADLLREDPLQIPQQRRPGGAS